jgi:hypothetical protein
VAYEVGQAGRKSLLLCAKWDEASSLAVVVGFILNQLFGICLLRLSFADGSNFMNLP